MGARSGPQAALLQCGGIGAFSAYAGSQELAPGAAQAASLHQPNRRWASGAAQKCHAGPAGRAQHVRTRSPSRRTASLHRHGSTCCAACTHSGHHCSTQGLDGPAPGASSSWPRGPMEHLQASLRWLLRSQLRVCTRCASQQAAMAAGCRRMLHMQQAPQACVRMETLPQPVARRAGLGLFTPPLAQRLIVTQSCA